MWRHEKNVLQTILLVIQGSRRYGMKYRNTALIIRRSKEIWNAKFIKQMEWKKFDVRQKEKYETKIDIPIKIKAVFLEFFEKYETIFNGKTQNVLV